MNAKMQTKVTLVFEVGTNIETDVTSFNKCIDEESLRAEMALNQGKLRWHLKEVRY